MDLSPVFKQLYPEGSRGGECGVFAHNLIEFVPVGNSYSQKKGVVNTYGIRISDLNGDFRPGDVLICSDGTFMGIGSGHVAVVNYVNDINLFLTESNFKKDGKVHHNRAIPKNSSKIYGVLRGHFKFDLPTPQFPLQIETTILLNQPEWPSLLSRMTQLQDWFWKSSNSRIQLIINYKQVTVSGWKTLFYGSDPRVEAVTESWFNQNILPLAPKNNIVLLALATKDWHGTVFDYPGSVEYGYCYPRNPIKAMLVCDENTKTPWYPNMDGFVDIARHEISHGLYNLCVSKRLPLGTDLTHKHYLGNEFEKIFDDLDLAKLATIIN